MKLPRTSIVMCSNSGRKPTDPFTKHYRDSSFKKVNSPGKSGYVCIDTVDGETVCQKYSRFVFETVDTLSAPGERCFLNYDRPNSKGEPTVECKYGSVDPSKFTKPPTND